MPRVAIDATIVQSAEAMRKAKRRNILRAIGAKAGGSRQKHSIKIVRICVTAV